MNKEWIVGCIGVLLLVAVVSLSGCESGSKQASAVDSRLAGTWEGSMPLSMFRGGGNSTVTEITFSGTMAILTVSSEFGSRSMNCSFQTSSGSLVLTPEFRGGFSGRPFNGTRGNASWPGNGTRPNWNGSNWTRPPSNFTTPNGSSPWNGTRPTWNGTRPQNRSTTMTYTYRFSDDGRTLYLDNAVFTKV